MSIDTIVGFSGNKSTKKYMHLFYIQLTDPIEKEYDKIFWLTNTLHLILQYLKTHMFKQSDYVYIFINVNIINIVKEKRNKIVF